MRKFASPFLVLIFCSLAIVGSRAQGSPTVFINEIHYDNTGTDAGEFVEIAGPAGTNLTGYSIVLYNGADRLAYDTKNLSGTISNQSNGWGTVVQNYPVNGIQNGSPDAVALVFNGTLIQFLSYEGTFVGLNGAANGVLSTDIGVSENGSGPVGESLRLIGTGNSYANFSWAPSAPGTPGAVNQGQTFTTPPDLAPTVTSTTPAAGASNVAVATPITINFSESINATASAFSLTCGGNAQLFTPSASPSSSITLTPNSSLPFSSNCAVVVTATQITDNDANDPPDQMATNFNFSFTTAAPTDSAPAVVSTVPANGATDVNGAANIVINFSEQVTATTSAFEINCGAGLVAFGQTPGASMSFALDPNVNLPGGADCGVTVRANQVSDLDANDPPDHLAGDYSFSFRTAVPVATNVMINELDADTPGVGFDLAEFVELYDGGVGNTPLNGLTVVFYDGTTDASYSAFDLDGYTTNAQGYFTLGNPGVAGVDLTFEPGDHGFLQNGADAVALVIGNASSFPNGTVIAGANVLDAIVYDTDDDDDAQLKALLNASQPQINENAGGDGPNQSIGRCANGTGGPRNTFTYRSITPTPDGPNDCPPPPVSPIVISQLYGGGGNSGATYQNDFVELYNRSNATVDITGWSLQYASATGSGWDFNKTPLGGPIAPGEYYLVKLASNDTTIGLPLPAPNVTGLINMAAGSGKIALVGSGESLVGDCPLGNPNLRDLAGYGSATCSENLHTAPGLSATRADFRLNGGSQDTNDNAADFDAAAPNPRRTAPITELRPYLLSADPAANAINVPHDPTIAMQFSEPVTTTGDDWFDLTCASSGAHNSYTRAGTGNFIDLTINDPLTPGEKCTITILQNGVHDADTDDAPGTDTLPWNYQWSFTVSIGTAPPYPPSVHLTFGNPTNATADTGTPENFLMQKPEYALSYNRDLGRPNWVSWHLSNEWYGTLSRVDTFRADPQVPPEWHRVQGFDFSGSGFDRGHMVPNADRDKETSIPINQATYLMSNMVAQAPDNNQGPWAAFEGALRTIADAGNEIYIVAGPAGEGGTGSNGFATTIAGGDVSVPASTWKAALVLQKQDGDDVSRVDCLTRTIAVIMPNVQGIRNDNWMNYRVSIDQVEALTGFDLFSNLPAGIEYCVEARTDGDPPVPADTTAPVIHCDSPDGAWHDDNITLTCTATDVESGLANHADASFTLSTLVVGDSEDANASTDSRVVCDVVGNCATAGPIAGNKIDRKNPAAAITTPTNGAVYQLNQVVNAAYACVDGGSGIATCAGNVANGTPIDTASSGPKTFAVIATDIVGNSSTIAVTYTVSTGPAHKRNPSIFINNIPSGAVAGGSFTPTFDYDGDGQVHLKSDTPAVCKVKGDRLVEFVGAGTCTISAWATASGSVNQAIGPLQSFQIVP